MNNTLSFLNQDQSSYSEDDTKNIATEFARHLGSNDFVFLEGPMGVGKSTFSRYVIEQREGSTQSSGSPSFSFVHEYENVIHIDFYRIKSEAEFYERGIDLYFFEKKKIFLTEWSSLWDGFTQKIIRSQTSKQQNWLVQMDYGKSSDSQARSIKISHL